MTYRDYICDDCGFSSEEKPGVYLCPKCHNKMRKATAKGAYGGGDNTVTGGKILVYVLLCIFLLPILFAFLNVFGLIIFVVIFYFVRSSFNTSIRDKAIPVTLAEDTPVEIPSQTLYCGNCGHELAADSKFCPNCGKEVLHK